MTNSMKRATDTMHFDILFRGLHKQAADIMPGAAVCKQLAVLQVHPLLLCAAVR